MRKLTLLLTAIGVLGLVLVVAEHNAAAQDGCTLDGEKTKAEKETADETVEVKIKKLRSRISFINLLNGLNMTKSQLEKLLQHNKEVKLIIDDKLKEIEEFRRNELKTLEELERVIGDQKTIPKDLEARVGKIDAALHRMRKEMSEAIVIKYKPKIEAVFTDGQKAVIEDFEPCAIPPQDLKDPVRVGQAGDSARVIELMRKVRAAPRRRFDQNLDRLIDMAAEHVAEHYNLTGEEQEKQRGKYRKLFEKIYEMEDIKFEIEKEELAKELNWEGKARAKELDKELRKIGEKTNPGQISKICQYFLDPEIVIPVLGKRLGAVNGDSETIPEETGESQKETAKKAPKLSFKTFNGVGKSFSRITCKAKATLMVVVDARCPYCERLLKELKNVHTNYTEEELRIFAVNINEEKWLGKLKKHYLAKKLPFEVLMGNGKELKELCDVDKTPTTFLLNEEGEIVFVGGSNTKGNDVAIRELLGKKVSETEKKEKDVPGDG
jgi:thioredoxin-related protein